MPAEACGSQRKRSVPALASLILQRCVPTKATVVFRLYPGAITCALWDRDRSRTVSE